MNFHRLLLRTSLLVVLLSFSIIGAEPLRLVSSPLNGFAEGRTAAAGSYAPSFSPDGLSLAFLSEARNLVTNDAPSPYLNIYVYSLATGKSTLASVSKSGVGGGNENTINFSLSSNAQFVAFDSGASNLGETSQWARGHVYLRDSAAKSTSLGSYFTKGTPMGGAGPLISSDARWLYYQASLYSTYRGSWNVLARDLKSNQTYVVSFGQSCLCDDGSINWSTLHSINPDGRFVVFDSETTGGDTNVAPTSRLYVRDMQTGAISWASTNLDSCFSAAGGSPPFSYNFLDAVIDGNGRWVAICARAYNQALPFGSFVLLHDLQTQTSTLVSTNGSTPRISADGRFVSYSEETNIFVWDTQLQSNILVSVNRDGTGPANGPSKMPIISSDGHWVVFLSAATDLVTNPVNGQFQLYVRSLLAGTTRLVSANTNGFGMCTDLEAIVPAISPNGQLVAFNTAADDLVGGDQNQASDVFVRDLASETTQLISGRSLSLVTPNSSPAFSTKSAQCMSSNGHRVVFTSSDSTLVPNDTNGCSDVFVQHLLSGNLSSPGIGTSAAGDAVISADGRYVVYTRRTSSEGMSSFGAGNIYRYDIQTGSNVLASVGNNGSPAGFCSMPTISPDGRYIAFQSRAGNLVAQGGSSYLQIYMRDMELGSNVLVSVRTTGEFGEQDSSQPEFSPDGRWLLFRSLSHFLVYPFGPPNTYGNGALYAYDMVLGTNVLASVMSTYFSIQNVSRARLSANSRYLAFVTDSVEVWACDLLRASNTLMVAEVHLDTTKFYSPGIDNSGRFVVYEQQAPYGSRIRQIILSDLQTRTTNIISCNRWGTGGGNAVSTTPVITSDGQFVVFASKASDLVEGDTNGVSDIFVRDRLRNITTLVSVNSRGQPGNGASTSPVLAGDGRTVIFQSLAGDLVEGDYNMKRDLFLLKLGTGDTDGDGLDDDWEMAYFSALSRDGSGDFDADGLSDKQEFLAGTDPTNAGSVLRVMMLNAMGGNTSVLWPAAPGRVYRLQVKTNLADTWQDWPAVPTVNSGTASVTIDASPANEHRFYRAVLLP